MPFDELSNKSKIWYEITHLLFYCTINLLEDVIAQNKTNDPVCISVSKGSSEGSSCSTPSKVPPLVGSQKRKARRLQITRVDPNSVARGDKLIFFPSLDDIKTIRFAEGEALLSDIGLATLAEVAAVTKRLIKQ